MFILAHSKAESPMAMYREACVDMDNPHQDVQGDALREETRKLRRRALIREPLGPWAGWFGDAC